MYDLTALLSNEALGTLADPLVAAAGEDISHWFDLVAAPGEGGSSSSYAEIDVRYFEDPATGLRAPYTPHGAFAHCPVVAPTAAQPVAELELPWWRDERCLAGRLTRRARKLRVTNSLTSHEHVVEFGVENTVEDMQTRFLEFNAHCGSYLWKALIAGAFRPLDVHKTLEENGVVDDAADLDRLGLDAEDPNYLIDIMIAFKDDLTVG